MTEESVCTLQLASRGRSKAEIRLCHRDEHWWYGISLDYSYGGFSFPTGYGPFESRQIAEREAAEHVLRHFPKPFNSDPDSVKAELADLRSQVEARLSQPSLL